MYDRKTWVVLAVCGSLLAVNLYYQGQNTARQRELQRVEESQRAAQAPPTAPLVGKPAELTVPVLPPSADEKIVELRNDKITYKLTNIGGGLLHAEFQQEFNVGDKSQRVQINRFGSGPIGALAGPDESLENVPYEYLTDRSIPGKKAVYRAQLPSGLMVTKSFTLVESKAEGAPYLLDFGLQLENTSATPVRLSNWSIYLGEASPLYQAEVEQQTGVFWRADGTMNFVDQGLKDWWFQRARNSWRSASSQPLEFAGVTNQFFATAIRPESPVHGQVWARSGKVTLPGSDKPVVSVRAGLQLEDQTLDSKGKFERAYRIFAGPKHNPLLRKMNATWGDGWGDLMQYGWFGMVSRILNYLLNTYHGWLDGISKTWSWGLAIILLTITVRIVIWPLHAKSTHTMKRMSKLQPEMARIKEKHAGDPNKINTETMGLYRKYGINPLGGCLPMFIQIPIFFGFYRMLQYAVELRGQGFLWVDDLSQPDTLAHWAGIPINLLPVVMAISSFLQIKMTPKTGDAMQQRIIMFMPFMFFFFCYNFASALALYWTTQNIFSIGQTWLMNKVPEPELKPVKGGGKSWVQRMAERQTELQKLRQAGKQPGMRDVTPASTKKKRNPRTGG